jgi:hypothetical protein
MRRAQVAMVLLALLPPMAAAQIISTKTVPVTEGDQFRFLPSANVGMADVGIALSDTLLDPFVNPATAARQSRGRMFGSPTFFSMSHGLGGGSTVPAGAWLRSSDGSTFGALAAAFQVLDSASPPQFQPPIGFLEDKAAAIGSSAPTFDPNETPQLVSRTNRYLFASLGHAIRERGLSFAGSAMWADLHSLDGADAMYAGARSVRQNGSALDVRVGAIRDWGKGESLELLALHRRIRTSDAAQFPQLYWNPDTRQLNSMLRTDRYVDDRIVTGLNARYQRPMAKDSLWNWGALLTANRETHPRLPDYGPMNVARDPARATALDLGLGVSRREGPGRLAVDMMYEPMWSRDSLEGARSDSRFRFNNVVLRSGASGDFRLRANSDVTIRVEGGIAIRSVHYNLSQLDTLGSAERLTGGWNEWVRTGGLTLRLAQLDVHYLYRQTSGLSRPFTPQVVFFEGVAAPQGGGGGFGGGPGPFGGQPQSQLAQIRVVMQQIYVSVPLP